MEWWVELECPFHWILMFYPSDYDTSSIDTENQPLRTMGVNRSKILLKYEVQNLYLKLEWGWGVPIVGLSIIVRESVPGAKRCGQPIWLKLGTEVGCDEIFQKPLWLTSLTFSFGVKAGGGGVSHFLPMNNINPAFQRVFWKCDKTPLVNCAAKWIWP